MIHISEIGVRYVMVFAVQIERTTPAGTKQLNTAPKLGGEVEVSCFDHAVVEIKKATTGSEERLDMTVMHPIQLRTNRTSTHAVGILSAFRCHGSPTSAIGATCATQRTA